MKIKRETAGKYTLTTEQGLTTITKENDKWWITFPCGKKSYRRSYELAKKWAISYLEKNLTPVKPNAKNTLPKSVKNVKSVKSQSKATQSKFICGNTDVKEAVANHKAYLTGAEYYGCVNTGCSACILNYEIQGTTYFLVGKEGDITDTYIHKYLAHIKYEITDQAWIHVNNEFRYKTDNDYILVTKDFTKAYQEFMARNNKVVEYNTESRQQVEIAKKNKDYLTLIDHGFIF